jgi:hypothetical protein
MNPEFPPKVWIMPICDRMGGYVATCPGKGLIIPADGLMEAGEPGSIVPYPPGLKTMFRKIILCTMLVLILAPAAVMATGQQGQAQGIGNEAGNGLHVQQKIASETMVQEKFQYGQGQGVKNASQNGDALMKQTRSCDQACEQDQARIQNMTRDQIRLNTDADHQQDGSADSVQNRFGLTNGNGQNILTSFVEQLTFQFRHAMGLVQTTGQ